MTIHCTNMPTCLHHVADCLRLFADRSRHFIGARIFSARVLRVSLITVFVLCMGLTGMSDDHSDVISSQTLINSTLPSPEVSDSEVWELSTRHLPDSFRCINVENPGFDVHRFTNCRWQKDEVENALVHDNRLTILYVHGNFMEQCNARQRALIVDQFLKTRTCQPYRLIMLSWPSQRENKPLRDVYENAHTAECQSLYFAWLLDRLSDRPQVSILGFSFGSRAVTGGLHLVSGGSIPGLCYRSVRPPESTGTIYRVGLVAPAIDRSWLTSRGRNGMALEHVDALINLYNSRDPVLRRFRFMDRLSNPIAAGFAGFVGLEGLSNPRARMPLESSSRVRQFDCGSVIGTTHSEKSYYGECPYFRLLIDNLLWKESSGEGIPR